MSLKIAFCIQLNGIKLANESMTRYKIWDYRKHFVSIFSIDYVLVCQFFELFCQLFQVKHLIWFQWTLKNFFCQYLVPRLSFVCHHFDVVTVWCQTVRFKLSNLLFWCQIVRLLSWCQIVPLPLGAIPHICQGRADGVRVNFFWSV